MAYSAWLNPSKTSGSGNDTVNVTALSDHTGRVARSTVMTFKGSNVADVPVTVNQAGKPEFVTIQATAAVNKAGGTLTVSGTSNSSKLTFALGTGATLPLTLPAAYTANSIETNNGVAIAGDPGAGAEYNFSITFTDIPANTSIDDLLAQLIVTDNAGHEATCNITQAAGDATLSVTPTTVNLDWNAATESTSASVQVTSNTSWTID